MTTLTSVEQLRELPEDTVIRERGGSVLQKDGDGWETTYGSFVDHEGVQLPAQTLHPRTISVEELKEAALAMLMVTQGDIDPEYAWSVQYEEVQDEMLAQAAAALTALGFEVTE